MDTLSRRLAAIVVAALLAVACGPTAPTSIPSPSATAVPATPSPASTPSGAAATDDGAALPVNGRIEVAEQGYAITIPDNWFTVDLDSDEMSDIIDAGAGELPEGMEDMLAGQAGQLAAAGISLFAFRNADATADFGTTVNVLSLPSLGLDLDTLEQINLSQLESALGAGTEIESERVTLPIGEALRIAYDLPLQGGTAVGTVQYLVATDSKQLILSCGSPSGIDAIAAECLAMAESLETLP